MTPPLQVSFVAAPAAPPQPLRKALEGLAAEFIMHARTRKVHKASLDEEAADKGLWAAPCGWRYGGTSFFRLSEQPPGADLCRRCFPDALHHELAMFSGCLVAGFVFFVNLENAF